MAYTLYAPETADIFEIVGPDGARAVLNDPTSPDYVGSVSDLSGFDSPEVQESKADRVEEDGSVQGNNWHGGRPWTISGQIHAPSRVERNQRWSRLSRATNAMREDGTVTWTPSGGEEVFVRFRRQQPVRLAGGWTKDYFLGAYSADHRIYATDLQTYFFNKAAENLTATAGASATTTLTSVPVTFPQAGTYTIHVWINLGATWNGGNVSLGVSGLTGSSTANSVPANGATTGTWQMLSLDVTVAAGDLVGDIVVTSASAPGSGKTALLQMPQISGAASPTITATWVQATGYTNTYAVGTVHGPDPSGGCETPQVVRLYGPGTNPTISWQHEGGAISGILANAGGGLTLAGGEYVDFDFATRRVIKNDGTSLYSKVNFVASLWPKLLPVEAQTATSQPVWVTWASGSTTASLMRVAYRNAWIG